MRNVRAGDLAVVVKVIHTNEMKGRFVVVERLLVSGELIEGYRVIQNLPGPAWIVRSAVNGGLLPWRLKSGRLIYVRERPFCGAFMRPIRDPGDDAKDQMLRPLPKIHAIGA